MTKDVTEKYLLELLPRVNIVETLKMAPLRKEVNKYTNGKVDLNPRTLKNRIEEMKKKKIIRNLSFKINTENLNFMSAIVEIKVHPMMILKNKLVLKKIELPKQTSASNGDSSPLNLAAQKIKKQSPIASWSAASIGQRSGKGSDCSVVTRRFVL